MSKRGALILLVAAAIGACAFWFLKGRDTAGTKTTPAVTQGSGAATTSPQKAATGDGEKMPAKATVTVTGDKGPIADAMVRLAPPRGEVLALRTGADGKVTTELEPGRYTISGSANGYWPKALAAQEIAAGQTVTLSLTLAPGGRTLSGVVTDATGGPVAGARIDAARFNTNGRREDAIASTITANDGRYQMTVAEGHHVVVASSLDYAPQSRNVDVGPAGATADFALVPGGVIEGFVRDAQTKEPIAGAVVMAARDGGSGMAFAGGTRRRATSGTDGRFRIGGLSPGAYELEAQDDERSTRQATVVGLGVAEQISDVELLVGRGATISGTVVDETNTPVPAIDVIAFGPGRSGGSAEADGKGAFVLTGLPPGSHSLMARSETFSPVLGPAIELADKDVTGVVVKVRRGIAIVGHVEPRQVCEIDHELEGPRTGGMFFPLEGKPTGPDGAFSLSPADPGQARLIATCESGDRGELVVEVKAGMPEVVLAVKPGSSIAGKVVDATGKPVSGMTVMASPRTGTIRTTIVNGMVTSGVQGLTGMDGTYRLVGVPEGEHKVTVLDRGRPARMRSKPPVVTLGPAEKKTGVDLAIDLPNGVIEGVVTGPDGKPLADAWVSVHQDVDSLFVSMADGADDDPDDGDGKGKGSSRMTRIENTSDGEGGAGGEFPPVLTDAQGRFAVRSLPHAKYEVIAEAQAGALRGRAVNVSPDAKLTIQALGVTSLSGTVKGANGPVAVFTLELEGPTSAARTFTNGTFKLGRVDPGSYTVRVKSNEGNGEAKVTVIANQPATVDVVLAANGVVVGKLVDVHGKPLADTGVTLIPDAGPGGPVKLMLDGMPPMSKPDGSFRVEGKAGKMMLIVMTMPSPTIKRGLVLEPGKTIDAGTITVDPTKPPTP